MKRILLIGVSLAALSACAPRYALEPLCDREAQEWNKFDTAEDVCASAPAPVPVPPVFTPHPKPPRPDIDDPIPNDPEDDPEDDPESDRRCQDAAASDAA